ncbi:argininosuccinate synthase [Thermorudis peleae]|uniref:argininosuccinate synthase n=1 Tax=Thermorudis peleae TaxID=1382356 RepID=UPI00057162D9|nr:argininosuccinate synthase [Thermorudis peleae]MBX6753115.1 argininosuccinate synthase [Thermorudis peleae]
MGEKPTVKKVVLAYSGGLDTSTILKWIKETYQCEVITFTADIGQGDDLSQIEQKALATGASKAYVLDLKEEFLTQYAFPTLRAGAVYERKYLLGTSFARPLIAKYQVEIAKKEGADAVAHGCTGKGNDQVRFELTYKALAPELKVIAPWREWDLSGREALLEYAASRGIPVSQSRENIYSRDQNLWHLSHEGGPLEDPWTAPREDMFQLTKSPEAAPDTPVEITLGFEQGYPVSLNGERLDPVTLLEKLNQLGGEHGIGRIDLVENRLVGMKSRGVYEQPGATILAIAHNELESITLDRETLHYKDLVAQKYAELVYYGLWFTPLREALDAFVDVTQRTVTGEVRLKLYKGNCIVLGRRSPYSLYQESLATFGADAVYNQKDAEGFINLFGLPLTVAAFAKQRRQSS